MASYPEWFQPVEDHLTLGPRASFCVLRWTWLGLASQSGSGRKFMDALGGLETTDQHTGLDRDTCFQFFVGLPEPACRQIHSHLREPQFRQMLAGYRSVWRRIQDEYESQFDPATHLRACEANLEQDWRYGEPLIAEGLSRQDFAAAERFVQLTLSSLLRYPPEKAWCPERELLPWPRYHRSPAEEEAIDRLLDQWEVCATRRGNLQRTASLRLQRTLLKSPEDWAIVLAAYQEYERQPGKPKADDRLFAEWRQRIANACEYQGSTHESRTDTWIHRLIESQRDPAAGQQSFRVPDL